MRSATSSVIVARVMSDPPVRSARVLDADAFVVGTELARTLDQKDQWLEIIRAVREVTDAPLTYAAKWDTYDFVYKIA